MTIVFTRSGVSSYTMWAASRAVGGTWQLGPQLSPYSAVRGTIWMTRDRCLRA